MGPDSTCNPETWPNIHPMKAPPSTMISSPALLQGFPPVVNAETHTLILGSFPGVASLDAAQYYAYKQNQFWRLVSASLGTDLVVLDYEQRLRGLLAHGIGLWDVFHSCVRTGSLDSAIREGKLNDFSMLQACHPKLRKLCFNGQTAGKMAAYFQEQGYLTAILPSSSPAYAMRSFEEKLQVWQSELQPQ
ncbi:G/U mismatch-specific uracil-DNA glycosylase [Undibacterium pigrum]|uniref:G/U mismatch-specific uracil-DNA glycosylase n=1 Tax=Undibacterium pigrum TaxID=401470 RepID=A0A318IYJ3_9BURK|nr:G/U mismatch-specific uracil-DNA glycosylase [Undibacterium pigrum]